MATYLKTFQALCYERLQAALSDLFGLTLQGGLMNLLRRVQGRFRPSREAAVATLRRAQECIVALGKGSFHMQKPARRDAERAI